MFAMQIWVNYEEQIHFLKILKTFVLIVKGQKLFKEFFGFLIKAIRF